MNIKSTFVPVAISGLTLLSACTTLVDFTSTPPGARVTYNNQVIGTTPFQTTITDQWGYFSEYKFVASMDGYQPETRAYRELTPFQAQQVVPHQIDFPLAAFALAAPPAPPPTVVVAPPPPPPAPPVAPVDEKAGVRSAVMAWAQAWSSRDLAAYLACYDPAFKGKFATRAGWEKQRKQRIVTRTRISVNLDDIKVDLSGDRAQAKFFQIYVSNVVKNVDAKTLGLKRDASGKWLIDRETIAE